MTPTVPKAVMRQRIAEFASNPDAVDNLCKLLRRVAGKTGKKSSEGGRKARREKALARIEFYGKRSLA